MADSDGAPRCGTVAVAGLANAGKSTLVNRIAGAPISIVTHKAQTTRRQTRGIASIGLSQVALVDTPGLVAPRGQREQRLLREAWHGLDGVDAVAVVVDAAARSKPVEAALEAMAERLGKEAPAALVLNKVDRTKRDALLPLAASLNEAAPFDATFMVSARTGNGVQDLAQWMAATVPEGDWRYPEDCFGNQSETWRAEEATRRQALMKLHGEIPYRLTVATEWWNEGEGGAVDIEQTLLVERESQRRIAMGREGRTLAAIQQAAARDIEKALGRKASLTLKVKVGAGAANAVTRGGTRRERTR